jgi:hypothetical protein
VRVDTHELKLLAADLEKAQREIAREIEKVTGKACNQIKKDAARRAAGNAHLPYLPRSITYDVTTSGTRVKGEVGADHARPQGKLAWVLEYGTPTSAPRPMFAPAADKEVPVWERYCEEAAAKVLGGD